MASGKTNNFRDLLVNPDVGWKNYSSDISAAI